jgi:hypothetical protein
LIRRPGDGAGGARRRRRRWQEGHREQPSAPSSTHTHLALETPVIRATLSCRSWPSSGSATAAAEASRSAAAIIVIEMEGASYGPAALREDTGRACVCVLVRLCGTVRACANGTRQ